jgi:hypothetical protein
LPSYLPFLLILIALTGLAVQVPSSVQQQGVGNFRSILDSSEEAILDNAKDASLVPSQQSLQQNITMPNPASRNMIANINIVKLGPGQIATPAGIVIDASQVVSPNGKTVSPQINGIRLNPTIISGWTENTGWTYSGSITFMSAEWRVPPSPTTNGGLVYWFMGMQSAFPRIIQPILQYGFNGAYGGNYWLLVNWWCCSPASYGSQVRVSPGDLIYGSVSRSGDTWTIHAADLSSGTGPSDLVLTDSDTYDWAATALEMYNINTCDQISGGVSFESITLQSGSTTLSANWWTSVNYSVCGLGSDDVIVYGSSQTILNTADPYWDLLAWSSGSIPLGGYFDIMLRVKNYAGTAYSQTAVLSFPSNAASLQITSTNMAQTKMYSAGSTLSGCYSTCSVVLSYPIAIGSSSLKTGQTGYITVRVYPTQVGAFNVYFKTLAFVHGVSSDFAANWDPTSGTQDQQNEYVNSLSLTVNPAVIMSVSYSVVGGGIPVAPVFHYILSGVTQSLTLTLTSRSVLVDPGTTWSVAPNLLGGSSSSQRWYSNQALTGTASSTTLVFVFYRQMLQALSYSVSGGGSGYSPPTFQANQFGAANPVALTNTATGYWYDYGSPWTVTNPLDGSTLDERWFTTQATTGSITGSATRFFTYQHQFYLTMQVTPSGSVSPNCGWHNAGQRLTISATANSGYGFLFWTGSGAGSYTGTSVPATITMNSAITETANFGVKITITSTPTGSGYVTVDGAAVTAPHTYVWVIGDTHTIAASSSVSCGSGCQYVFTAWSDSGDQSHTITVPDSPTTYTATFQRQYLLTTTANPSAADSVAPSSGWYDAGQKITLTATPNTGYTFKSWKGTGSGSYTGTNPSPTITMNSAITETANFT